MCTGSNASKSRISRESSHMWVGYPSFTLESRRKAGEVGMLLTAGK